MIQKTFLPKKFCREFVELREHSGQLSMIMATIKGVKPAMDDWINIKIYQKYLKVCKKYGLLVRPDTIFDTVQKKEIPSTVIGRENLCTTTAFGLPFNHPNVTKGSIHVFIAKKKENLERVFKNGWYPLIIKNRVINRPLIDAFKFGFNLGYPNCCIDFFRKYNNWYQFSFLYEAFRNTPSKNYHFFCNTFIKDMTYSYAYHMPCSYCCPETIKLVNEIRKAIKEEEPEFVEKIDKYLKFPLLVFYERKCYVFEGEIKNKKLHYKNVYFISQMPENNLYERDIKNGDCLFLEDKDVIILKGGRLIKRIKWHEKNFASETPFLIQFSNCDVKPKENCGRFHHNA